MAGYQGHCICGSVQVSLAQEPPNSLVCHWYVAELLIFKLLFSLFTVATVLDRGVVSGIESLCDIID